MLNRFTDWCLSIAANRWPADRQAERLQEWQAELGWLREQPGAGRIRRCLTQLRFGWSLAMSPKIQPDGSSMGWRELLPGIVRGFQPVLAIAGVVILCRALFSLVMTLPVTVFSLIDRSSAGPAEDLGSNWAVNAVSVACIVAFCLVTFFIGRWLGTRAPIASAHRGRFSKTGSAIAAPAVIAATMLLADFLTSLNRDQFGDIFGKPNPYAAYGVWFLLITLTAFVVDRLAHSGRRTFAWVTGAVGALIAMDLAGIASGWSAAVKAGLSLSTAPLWFPLAVIGLEGTGISSRIDQGLIDAGTVVTLAGPPIRAVVIFTFFLVGYGFAASRAKISHEPVVRTAEPGPAAVTARWSVRQWAGAGFAAIFITLWGYAVSALTASLTPETDPVEEHHIWVHELRQAAILGIAASLWLMLAGHRPVIVPSVLTFGILIAADSFADGTDAQGPDTGLAAAALATIVLCGAWLLSQLLAQAFPPTAAAGRRTLAAMAVLTLFAAPVIVIHVPSWPTKLPWTLYATGAAVVGLLVAIGLVCALAARDRPIRMVSATAIVVVVSVFSAYPLSVSALAEVPLFGAAGPILAALAAVLIRPQGKVWKWAGLFAAAVILAVPLAYLQIWIALIPGEALMAAAGYQFPVDGLPIIAGTIIAGIGLAAAVASTLVPKPAPSPIPTPGPVPA